MSITSYRLYAFALMVVVGAGLSMPPLTAAQTPYTFEMSAGYQLLHVPDDWFPFGLNIDGSRNLNNGWGVVGELGWAHNSDDELGIDISSNVFNLGAGPRWTSRRNPRVMPFGQVLAGLVHARTSGDLAGVDASDTHFMLQPGVGVTFVRGDGWGIVGAVDYRRVFLDEDKFGESGQNVLRVFLGLRMLLD